MNLIKAIYDNNLNEVKNLLEKDKKLINFQTINSKPIYNEKGVHLAHIPWNKSDMFICNGIDPQNKNEGTTHGEYPLYLAVEFRLFSRLSELELKINLQIIRVLLDYGSNPNLRIKAWPLNVYSIMPDFDLLFS